jgi:lysophospholipase L1-like esterase
MRKTIIICLLMIMAGCAQNDRNKLVVCCAGDSLMRPIPYHLREMLKSPHRKIDIRDWSQGGLSSQSYQIFFTRHYLSWRKVKPDFILIQLGTNDLIPLLNNKYQMADFEKNLNTIIKNFKRFKGNRYKRPKIFMASVPLCYDDSNSKEKNRLVREEINPAIKKIAKIEKLFLVDNFLILTDKTHLYSPDGVHPSPLGEKAIAKNWLLGIRCELRKDY